MGESTAYAGIRRRSNEDGSTSVVTPTWVDLGRIARHAVEELQADASNRRGSHLDGLRTRGQPKQRCSMLLDHVQASPPGSARKADPV